MSYVDLLAAGISAINAANTDDVRRIAKQMYELNPHLPHSLNLERSCAQAVGDTAWLRQSTEALEASAPYYRDVGLWLASDKLANGDFAAARSLYDKALARPLSIAPSEQLPVGKVTAARLKHDGMQAAFLVQKGIAGIDSGVAARYFNILNDHYSDGLDPYAQSDLSAVEILSIADFYRRCIHLRESPSRRSRTVLREDLSDCVSSYSYRDDSRRVIVIDDIFRSECAEAIYDFLLESTIWHCDSHRSGAYIGSNDLCGLGHPLLHDAAREIEASLTRSAVSNARVQQFWSFRCTDSTQGIGLHADVAKLNLNVWLTPDEYFPDPELAGLRIYNARRPKDWSHDDFNGSDKARTIINSSDCIEIPYKANRGVLFDSRYFHESIGASSKVLYEGLRTNITFVVDYDDWA